jgi:hypothetical protein
MTDRQWSQPAPGTGPIHPTAAAWYEPSLSQPRPLPHPRRSLAVVLVHLQHQCRAATAQHLEAHVPVAHGIGHAARLHKPASQDLLPVEGGGAGGGVRGNAGGTQGASHTASRSHACPTSLLRSALATAPNNCSTHTVHNLSTHIDSGGHKGAAALIHDLQEHNLGHAPLQCSNMPVARPHVRYQPLCPALPCCTSDSNSIST